MSQIAANADEVEPTYWRLTKIFWSQFWRLFLILLPVFACIFAYGAFMGEEIKDLNQHLFKMFPSTIDVVSDIYLMPYYAGNLFFCYVLDFLMFFLILGKNYKDFTFSFVPTMGRKTQGYWLALFKLSWAYFWRTTIFVTFTNLVQSLISQFSEHSGIDALNSLINVGAFIFFLGFVVNKQYGNFRLSLLKREIKA